MLFLGEATYAEIRPGGLVSGLEPWDCLIATEESDFENLVSSLQLIPPQILIHILGHDFLTINLCGGHTRPYF
jgi:hypothetical protein